MSGDKPPFDQVRAAFFLVALVIVVECVVVLVGVGVCLSYADDIVKGVFQCDKSNRLTELLNAALSAALAFAAGMMKGRDR